MSGFLRYLGLLNAAVWLGGAIAFTLAVGPAFFSPEMTKFLPAPYNGLAAQVVLHRYFLLLNCCGGIALAQFFLEKLYLGKTVERLTLSLLLVVFSLSLLGGLWLQPKLRTLHLQKYSPRSSTELQKQAGRSFKIWHGVSQSMNLIVIGGLLVYFWRISKPPTMMRFTSATKFRS